MKHLNLNKILAVVSLVLGALPLPGPAAAVPFTLYAQGYNFYGELGNDTTASSTLPVAVVGVGGSGFLSGVLAVAGGNYHSLAMTTAGNVYAWGNNSSGQLGNDTTTLSTVPVEVVGAGGSGFLSGVVAVAAGDDHSLALTMTGNVYAWGNNSSGQLGNNTTTLSTVPVEVVGAGGSGFLSGVLAVAAGNGYSLALTTTGNVFAWGNNSSGQLGNNTTTLSTVPVEVVGVGGSGFLSGVVAVAAGDDHSLALTTTGNVYAWGNNSSGQLGNDTTTSSTLPVEVLGAGGSGFLSGVVTVAAGNGYSLALTTTGNVFAWGNNDSGELGNDTTTSSTLPVEVLGAGGSGLLSGVLAVAAGGFHVLAVVGVPVLPSTTNLAASGVTSTGATLNGTVNANGYSTAVSFDYGISTSYGANVAGTPTPVTGISATAVSATLTGLMPGTTYHYRVNGVNAGGTANSTDLTFTTLTNNANGTITLYAQGYNFYGELGNDTTASSTLPVAVVGVGGSGFLSGVLAVAGGNYHSLAMTTAGNVYAWGNNSSGQLGNDTTTLSTVPVEVVGAGGSGFLSGVVAVAAGDDHSLALTMTGNVYAWGNNSSGQLGNNTTTLSTVPVEVVGAGGSGFLSGVLAVAAGNGYSLALTTTGNVFAWGNNSSGQLGNNTTTLSTVPVEVVGVGGSGFLSGVVAVAAGNGYSLALTTTGNIYAWGNNSSGQLGNNTTTLSTVPVEVVGVGGSGFLSGVVAVAAGDDHSLALTTTGNVYAWGNNSSGQLGNDTTTSSTLPVEVLGAGGSGFLSGVVTVAAGNGYSLALTTTGNVFAWGNNDSGELGNDTTTSSTLPVEVLGAGGSGLLSGVLAVAAGGFHVLAVVGVPVLPSTTNLAASGVTSTGATLNGTVNANGYSTAVSFDYGISTSYGANVAGTPTPVTGISATAVSATLTGLMPGTTYHYRVNGVNAGGTANSTDLTFTTLTNIITPTPTLNIASVGNLSVLFFAASDTNYILQSTTNLASPDWVTASDAVSVIAVTVTNTSPARFFRLVNP